MQLDKGLAPRLLQTASVTNPSLGWSAVAKGWGILISASGRRHEAGYIMLACQCASEMIRMGRPLARSATAFSILRPYADCNPSAFRIGSDNQVIRRLCWGLLAHPPVDPNCILALPTPTVGKLASQAELAIFEQDFRRWIIQP